MEFEISGHVLLIDEEDAYLLDQYAWRVMSAKSSLKYVGRSESKNGKPSYVFLHRQILNAAKGILVDHMNGNGLDNRRCNLRTCTHAENMRNRRMHSGNKSGFKGVYMDKTRKRPAWKAEIKVDGRKICLGRYATPELAYEAYCAAAIRLHGEFARLK